MLVERFNSAQSDKAELGQSKTIASHTRITIFFLTFSPPIEKPLSSLAGRVSWDPFKSERSMKTRPQGPESVQQPRSSNSVRQKQRLSYRKKKPHSLDPILHHLISWCHTNSKRFLFFRSSQLRPNHISIHRIPWVMSQGESVRAISDRFLSPSPRRLSLFQGVAVVCIYNQATKGDLRSKYMEDCIFQKN